MKFSKNPYRIFVLAPFAPVSPEGFKPLFQTVDLFSLDAAMEKLKPVFRIPVSGRLDPTGELTLTLSCMKDFKPGNILKQTGDLPKPAADVAGMGTDPAGEQEEKVDDILSMVDTSAGDTISGPAEGRETGRDEFLGKIFADPDFRKAESAWRGLRLLLQHGKIRNSENIDIRICPVSHEVLEQVLNDIASLPGELLPNLVLIDLPFSNTTPMTELLERTAAFADSMMVPVCIWLPCDFFSIDRFDQFSKIPYLKHHLDKDAYIKWNKVKAHPGADWIIAACNGFLSRPLHEFENDFLFSAPVWGLGALCAGSVTATGWPMHFTRYTELRLEDLPVGQTGHSQVCSVQALFSEDRVLQFIESGITPLVGAKNRDTAFMPRQTFLSGESIRFGMFFNLVITTLIRAKEEGTFGDNPDEAIEPALAALFTGTGQEPPGDISVTLKGNLADGTPVYLISFIPPENLFSKTEKIEFSFSW